MDSKNQKVNLFIAIPGKEDALAKTFSIAHMRYAPYFNQRGKGPDIYGRADSIPSFCQ